MAQQGVQLDQEQLCCSICLDLLKDPVSVPCGHSYCMGCIKGFWDQDDQKGLYSCPQCRETFNPRPVLKKNNILAEVVESMKKTGLQAIPPDHSYAGPGDVTCDVCTGPGDVACDVCIGEKLKAVKTCLQCLVSYCDTHLQPHYQSPAFKKHKLVKASGKLEENICSLHDEVKKVFCRTDQQCICYLCCMEEHKGHDTISAAVERTERQKELDTSQQNIQQKIQEREKDVKVLHQEVESINHCADRAVEDSDTIFTELISSIERKRSEVREQIRDQQKHQVGRVEEQRQRVEQEVSELRCRHAELEQISHTEDNIHFLQSYTSLSKISESTRPSPRCSSVRHFDDVTVSVSKMRDKLEDILKEEATNVSETGNTVHVLLSTPESESEPKPKPEPKTRAEFLQYSYTPESESELESESESELESESEPEPRTRGEFLKYSYPLTLDPNTAHQRLFLSKGNRKVSRKNKKKTERFTKCYQVLSVEGLTGRRYWEVKWSGNSVYISVAYKDISRTEDQHESGFGHNDKSWSLLCRQDGYHFRHEGINTEIIIPGPVSSRVGVYLDHSAGILSFYRVTSTLTLLHRVQTTFTNTLYPGIWTAADGTAELCDIK